MTAGVVVWLLVLYAGGHEGYVTVGDLASEAVCLNLAERLIEQRVGSNGLRSPWYRCLSYGRAPR